MNKEEIPVRILIVDDDLAKLSALSAALEGMDVEIITVTSGMEALQQLLKQEFALVLLDVNMPIMNGFETAAAIRSRPRSEHLPILFITAEAMTDDKKLQGYALGAVDYIFSPVLPQILRSKASVFADLYRLRELSRLHNEELTRQSQIIANHNIFLEEQVAARTAELSKNEAQLSTILENLAEGVVVSSLEGEILHFNHAAIEMHGFASQNECLLQLPEFASLFELSTLDGTVLPLAQWPLSRVLNGESLDDLELKVRRIRDEWQRIFSYSGTPVFDANGVALLATLTLRDVTEQKESEYALRRSEESFRLLVNGTRDYAIIMLDPEGRIFTWNEGAQRLKGYSGTEIIGQPVERFYTPEDIESGKPARLLAQAASEGRCEDEGWRVRKDGSCFFADVVLTAIRNPAGELQGFSKITRDISERRRADEEILTLNRTLEQRVLERTLQLDEANRAKSDFLANMSHELRTPLNAIIGFSELLKDGLLGNLEKQQREYITDIFDAGEHLLSLINDILDLSKVEAGALHLDLCEVDVAALFKASTLVVREKALAHQIQLDIRIDPSIGTMLADERKLKQIAYNLLSNAVKFSPDGGTVSLTVCRCARNEIAFDATMPSRLLPLPPGDDADFIAIAVEDSGKGIAEQDLPKLFEPFIQVDTSLARKQGGTGLGLSLVRRLAELHGGTAGVASRPGSGSRFCVYLPFRAASKASCAATSAAGEVMTISTRRVPLALVVEDDDRMADLITAQLHREGFEVMRAATGEEALVRAAKHTPQLITLDIYLPAMDGWEFMRRMKADPQLTNIPVVIISVSDDMAHGLILGARRVLHKPFVREELAAVLAGLVDTRPDGTAARVLVADDNVKVVELVATLLEAEGCRVLRAYGGIEAIEIARSEQPDLLILDLMMPQVDGFAVASALRESAETARIPIVVLTSKSLNTEDRARLENVGTILEKRDFNHDQLCAELRRAIALHVKR